MNNSLHTSKYEITIRHNNCIFTCTIRAATITRIVRTMEDSGINDEVDFDSLPSRAKNSIINRITNHDRH